MNCQLMRHWSQQSLCADFSAEMLSLISAAGFHYGVDADHLPTWVLQNLVWATSPIADEYCLLPAKHTPPGAIESV